MNDLSDRVQALEQRVRELSDRLEIFQIVASYAPAFDSGSADAVANAFVEDGVFDVGVAMCENRAAVHALARGDERSPAQRKAIARGGGHVLSMPFVTLDGDTAVATCTSRFYLRDDDGYKSSRVTAVRIELVRTAEGWRIIQRTNRLLDDTDDGLALYRAAFTD